MKSVESLHEALKKRVESIIQLALAIVTPLAGDSTSNVEHRSKRVGLDILLEKDEGEN